MPAPVGNQFALGNKGGRPAIYDDPNELHDKVVEYFEYIQGELEETKEEKKPEWIRYPEDPTITGLALFLGFTDKRSLYDYAKKEEFSHSIKRALLVVENNYEKSLRNDKCTGVIFALKNMGWEDRKTQDLNVKSFEIDFSE